MNTSEVKCIMCGKLFNKLKKEINRCEKRNMKHCCTKSCSVARRNSLMTKEYWIEKYKSHPIDIKSMAGNRKDSLSPFRKFLNGGRASIIKHKSETNIDVNYLKEIWDNQKGICPYTGIKMVLPRTTASKDQTKSLKNASLDRINSKIGYMKGNVEFVCQSINLGKLNFTKSEMMSFIKEIVYNKNTLSITQAQPT